MCNKQTVRPLPKLLKECKTLIEKIKDNYGKLIIFVN